MSLTGLLIRGTHYDNVSNVHQPHDNNHYLKFPIVHGLVILAAASHLILIFFKLLFLLLILLVLLTCLDTKEQYKEQ